jgi:hypothetical protein
LHKFQLNTCRVVAYAVIFTGGSNRGISEIPGVV